MADVTDLGMKSVENLGLSPKAEAKLKEIHLGLADAYREQYMELLQAINTQASTLRRIQETLNILVQHVAPHIKLDEGVIVPIAVQPTGDLNQADLARALVVADPIGAGYTLSQRDLASALAPGVTQPDISVLVRAFKLTDDGNCAVVVRKGTSRDFVNYHPRAVARLKELILLPAKQLKPTEQRALERVRKRLAALIATPSARKPGG